MSAGLRPSRCFCACLYVRVWWRIAVVKSSDRDDVSSASSDYEEPNDASADDVTSAVTSRVDDADDDDDEYEIYDDIEPTDPMVQRPSAATTTTTTTAAEDDEDDLIYEVCDPVVAVVPSRDPVLAVTSPSRDPVTSPDYANMFYGRWDCSASGGDELAFRRGDLLHIVSRQFDEFGWWVGALNGRVGLVPKQYVTPAYQLVNT